MKVNQGTVAVLFGLCLLLEPTSSTILTTTLFTGFVGGFLIGKITLGTFLTIMNSLNRGQTPVASGTTSAATAAASNIQQQKVVTRGGSDETYGYQFQDISESLENQVRDRFLRELGKMDPLSCLPKVFCEISADPSTANGLFGESGIFGQQLGLKSESPKKKNKAYLKKSKNKEEDDLQEDEEDASDSDESDEDDDDLQDEESLKLREYQAKENQALESKALDELIDEFDDPISYYFILKDKKKNIHPELKAMMSEADLSRMDRLNNKRNQYQTSVKRNRPSVSSMLTRRIGQAAKSSVESSSRTIVVPVQKVQAKKPEETVDDAFASDPFFDEFSKSLNEPKAKNSIKFGQIELLRRSKRDISDDDEHDATMAKYRMAAKIAEKFRDPAKCQKVFNTCPFSSEEVMNMITKMNDQEETLSSSSSSFGYSIKKKNKKKKGQDDGLKNLKNTLLAIEKLNDVTVHAQFSGEPVDYEKIIREATQSKASETSDKILEDFEQFEDKVESVEKLEEKPTTSKKNKLNKNKSNSSGGDETKNKKKVVRRHRRHGELPQELNNERLQKSSRTSRLSLVSPSGPQKSPRIAYSSFEDEGDSEEDEDTRPLTSSIESKLQTRLQLKPPQRQRPYNKPHYTSSQESKRPPMKTTSEEEDDEINSPEYQETRVKVPTFSQTFQETVQNPPKNRNKPRPVHPIVKVKEQYAKAPTTTNSSPTTQLPFRARPAEGNGSLANNSGSTRYSPKPKPLKPQGVTQKFPEVEDDEDDANNSEHKVSSAPVSSPISKYKPKRPSYSNSQNSYISS